MSEPATMIFGPGTYRAVVDGHGREWQVDEPGRHVVCPLCGTVIAISPEDDFAQLLDRMDLHVQEHDLPSPHAGRP